MKIKDNDGPCPRCSSKNCVEYHISEDFKEIVCKACAHKWFLKMNTNEEK